MALVQFYPEETELFQNLYFATGSQAGRFHLFEQVPDAELAVVQIFFLAQEMYLAFNNLQEGVACRQVYALRHAPRLQGLRLTFHAEHSPAYHH